MPARPPHAAGLAADPGAGLATCPAPRVRVLNVGLLGYGCVGSAVDRLLTEHGPEIERSLALRPRVVRALVRDPAKPRRRAPADGLLTTDFGEIRDDPAIDVVVEAIGGLDPADDYVRELLEAGTPVVTANKQLLATRGDRLARVADDAGLPLRFEAAVCAAVPVVRTVCEALPPGSVERIRGIVNGTTNFVLTRMECGATLVEAVREAQAAGYAEADTSDDLSGADAAAKLALLSTVAFRERVHLDDVACHGIGEVTPEHLAAAAARGRRLRLVAEAERFAGSIRARVEPVELDADDPLARVPEAFNEIRLEGSGFGQLTLRGPGAGGAETASAIVGDILAVADFMRGRARSPLRPPTAAAPLRR